MSDDDKPLRLRTKAAKTPVRGISLWDDDRRAEHGADRRRQDRARSSPAIALPRDDVSDGAPDRADDQQDQTAPSQRITSDEALVEIWNHIEHMVNRSDSRRRETADHVMKIAADTGAQAIDKIRNDVDDLKRSKRVLLYLITLALTAGGGSIIAVGRGLYDRGAHEGADSVRLEHVERAIDRLRDDLRDLTDRAGRHSSLLPSESSDTLFTASKGNSP